jgi:hypothetical protein
VGPVLVNWKETLVSAWLGALKMFGDFVNKDPRIKFPVTSVCRASTLTGRAADESSIGTHTVNSGLPPACVGNSKLVTLDPAS